MKVVIILQALSVTATFPGKTQNLTSDVEFYDIDSQILSSLIHDKARSYKHCNYPFKTSRLQTRTETLRECCKLFVKKVLRLLWLHKPLQNRKKHDLQEESTLLMIKA